MSVISRHIHCLAYLWIIELHILVFQTLYITYGLKINLVNLNIDSITKKKNLHSHTTSEHCVPTPSEKKF